MKLINEQELSITRKYLFALISLSLAVFLVYSNSLTVEWHYDDHYNILENSNLRLTDFSWENVQKTFSIDEKFSRPVAYFTFALNYYFGQYNVFGYHLVNLLIHLITTLLLFIFILKTLNLQTIRDEYRDKAYAIALFSTFLWALHPIQVHAVTTIVQRMTSLSGMFYVMTMLLYLNGRLSGKKVTGVIYYFSALCAGILALGTKENAIMIPISLFLYDLILIQGIGRVKYLRHILIFCVITLALLTTVSLYFIDFSSILGGYSIRPFTLTERLLTEPRIIVFYISLLLYPISSRLTLLHDPAISHTLFDPWTTLPSILFISGVIFFAIRFSLKKPLWSFCILFFFLNHVVEGSFIPLELIYEHRNYVPSLFFFIPVSIAMLHLIRYFSYKNSLKYLFAFSFACFLMIFGHTVYARNQIMSTEIGLWLDNAKKSPQLSRVHNNIGEFYWKRGLLAKACTAISTAYHLNHEMNATQYGVISSNLGNCFFTVAKQFDKAKLLYEKALQLYPGYPSAYSGLGLIRLKNGDIAKAKDFMLAALKTLPDHPEYLHSLALIHFMEKHYDQCIDLANRTLFINKNDVPALMLLGQSYFLKGDFMLSIKYWTAMDKVMPRGILAKLALIELYILTDQGTNRALYLGKLKNIEPRKSIKDIFTSAEEENPTFPIYIPNRPFLETILLTNGFTY